VVVDEHRSLVTSANFTYSGQSQNIEVGVLLDDASFAKALATQLGAAAAAGIFRRWPGP
jgi:phosphatidylserine/phosphatidylglycerophosphate/cardiolipin synthase-like enzyme